MVFHLDKQSTECSYYIRDATNYSFVIVVSWITVYSFFPFSTTIRGLMVSIGYERFLLSYLLVISSL